MVKFLNLPTDYTIRLLITSLPTTGHHLITHPSLSPSLLSHFTTRSQIRTPTAYTHPSLHPPLLLPTQLPSLPQSPTLLPYLHPRLQISYTLPYLQSTLLPQTQVISPCLPLLHTYHQTSSQQCPYPPHLHIITFTDHHFSSAIDLCHSNQLRYDLPVYTITLHH
jgi:hypothetical protein